MSDPAKYRTKAEVESYKKQDPIEQVKATIMAKKYASDEEINIINKKVKEIVEEAVNFAENSEYPDASELYTDMYQQTDYPFITH